MGTDEKEVLACIEKYAAVFNTMAQEVLSRSAANSKGASVDMQGLFDPQKLSALLNGDIKVDSNKLIQQQMHYMQKQAELWQEASKAMMGEVLQTKTDEHSKKKPQDKRFAREDWDSNPVFRYIKESYLANSEMLSSMVDAIEFADEKAERQAKFFTRQYVNSLSPTNFVLTNPEVCEEVLKSKGQNLVKGMQNFLEDLEKSPLEAFKMRQTDSSGFTLGENLANTPGKIVYQNELMQLIHYAPVHKQNHQIPVLIVPPFINKYYVLDLDEKKSMVRGLLNAGYSVFMISWVNPDAELADNDFVDYMRKGPITAIEKVKSITEQTKVNLTGFCVGGTLCAMTVAYLAGLKDKSVNSLTLLTTLLDFSEPGEVANYFSEDMLPLIEQNADIKGVFDGRIIGMSFSLLRENSLFWSFFIDNYLKGKDPAPFDILHWNSDSTNIPAACFKQYLRTTYWENRLKNPEDIVIDGVKIDLSNIDIPTYFLSTISDHIVLWKGAYEGTKLVSGNRRFVLAGSGHLAGVINPTESGKYPHWINENLPDSADEWFEGATENAGSWWPDWHAWLSPLSGKKLNAPIPGKHSDLPALMDAPGSYVMKRLGE
ncbi:PHA/PHB synthase family protein [Alteromonas sp. P256]|uniref:PHA/PHB synthase family protein n=1 Tax=Alteromonas sp. P256 TaxID=3117399 RepID=UPI002FE058FB